MEDLKGQFVSFKYRDRKDLLSGFLIDYNNNWALLKYNPVDYVIDGYLILKTDKILKVKRDDHELFREKVLKVKNLLPTDKDVFPITDLSETLQFISDRFGAFKIEKKDDAMCFIGRFVKITKENLIIQELDPKANWVEIAKHKLKSIRTIEFDSDYVNSLILYSRSLS